MGYLCVRTRDHCPHPTTEQSRTQKPCCCPQATAPHPGRVRHGCPLRPQTRPSASAPAASAPSWGRTGEWPPALGCRQSRVVATRPHGAAAPAPHLQDAQQLLHVDPLRVQKLVHHVPADGRRLSCRGSFPTVPRGALGSQCPRPRRPPAGSSSAVTLWGSSTCRQVRAPRRAWLANRPLRPRLTDQDHLLTAYDQASCFHAQKTEPRVGIVEQAAAGTSAGPGAVQSARAPHRVGQVAGEEGSGSLSTAGWRAA